jgi:hypothetical protein
MTQKGRRLSPEHKAKISQTMLGHKVSAETKKKMSAAHRGMRITPAWRAKISQTMKRRWDEIRDAVKIAEKAKAKKVKKAKAQHEDRR